MKIKAMNKCVFCNNDMVNEVIKNIRKMIDYLETEYEDFWNNCDCPNNEKLIQENYWKKCKCKANKNHIYKAIGKLDECLECWCGYNLQKRSN